MDVVPTRDIEGCRQAHAALHATLAGLTDGLARRPSALPGWTVGHVLTHVARNADSVVRRLAAAAAGEVVDQYPGGAEGRATEIAAGAGRPAAELVGDVRSTSAEVERACAALPPEAWGRLTRSVSGQLHPATAVVFSRWREVEVHHVDLGLGYRVEDWPPALVEAWLPDVLAGLARRSDPARLLGWALGRAAPPVLRPWG